MRNEEGLVRNEWIMASDFHDLTEPQVLSHIAQRVKAIGKNAIVLLDLDSTLYEVAPRTHQILVEWLETQDAISYPEVTQAFEKLEHQHIGYSLKDTFASLGLSLGDPHTKKAWEKAKSFWSARFFSNEYLKYDHPYPGASEFVRDLFDLGAVIMYLTGRDEPGMGEGTRKNLVRDSFPWGDSRCHLLMKEKFQIPDLDHKMNAAEYVRRHGTLVASLENEPPNLVALYDLFPDAMHVFVDTICSDRPARPSKGLYRIKSFKE